MDLQVFRHRKFTGMKIDLRRKNGYDERKKKLHHFVVSLYLERLRHAGGSPKIIGCMKEMWSYLMNSFEDPQNIWRKIKKINNLDVYEETVEIIFRDENLIPVKNVNE